MRALLALLIAAAPAGAVMPTKEAREAAQKSHLGRPAFAIPTLSSSAAEKLVADFNKRHAGGLGGGIGTASGHGPRPARTPSQLAQQVLAELKATTGIDPLQLQLETETSGGGFHHAMFRQIYKGLPVEFVHVKVHFDDDGKLLGLSSNFRQNLSLGVSPAVGESIAAYTVKQDIGEEPRDHPRLVVVLDPRNAQPRLAWKITAVKNGRWRYFVDAQSGAIIMKFDDRRYATPAAGVVRGSVYELDSEHATIGATAQPAMVNMRNEYVFLAHDHVADATKTSTYTITTAAGAFQFAGGGGFASDGKIFSMLQGPFIRVANFRGASSFYDNTWSCAVYPTNCAIGSVWVPIALPTELQSAHPYSNGITDVQTTDLSASLNDHAVALAPNFTNFNVGLVSAGTQGEGADITDDDQVSVLDANGLPVGAFVGDRGNFVGPIVAGHKFSVQLKSNASGTQYGYEVATAQYAKLGTASGDINVTGVASPRGNAGSGNSDFDWIGTTFNVTGLRAEAAAFYHLNLMHDYFSATAVNTGNTAFLNAMNPITAMVLMGPSLVNAFYDPDNDDMMFGDLTDTAPSELFTDDATVSHHEYTHYMVQKIWNIQNFGEAGAISEANADYWSMSSLDSQMKVRGGPRVSGVGTAVNDGLGGNPGSPLRELDSYCHPGAKAVLGNGGNGTTKWQAEIHADSPFISQTLWDLRRHIIGDTSCGAAVGAVTPMGFNAQYPPENGSGPACADALVFSALQFFPESFDEFKSALKYATTQAAIMNAGKPCNGTSAVNLRTQIDTDFGVHVPAAAGVADQYDSSGSHNDGFATAVDISGMSSVSGTIAPASDIDFFTFAAGPGKVKLTLDLPSEGGFYSGYMMTIYDKSHNQIAQAAPPFDGFNTDGFGNCINDDCTSTQAQVVYEFNNPSQQQIFVEVSGGLTSGGSNSGVTNSLPYTLTPEYTKVGALSGSIVKASLDKDIITFDVTVATWTSTQEWYFSQAQLRDQAQNVLPGTLTPGTYLQTTATPGVSCGAGTAATCNQLGHISGTVQIQPGFNARFPSVGTVYLEIIAQNRLGNYPTPDTISLGFSDAINLTTNVSDVHVWNNVFNPLTGQKTTMRYDVQTPGHLTAKLYTMTGALVATLFDGEVPAGKGSVDWDGHNHSGTVVASGIYLLHVQGPGLSKTQKVAIIK